MRLAWLFAMLAGAMLAVAAPSPGYGIALTMSLISVASALEGAAEIVTKRGAK